MLFNSLAFVYFFILTSLIYFAVPPAKRWVILLVSSCYFYMFFIPKYILILFFIILLDYFSAIYLEKTGNPGHKKKFLALSIFINIGTLVFFKYTNFIAENILMVMGKEPQPDSPFLDIIFPIGLSFHTFQSLSYIIEVYRGNFKAEHHLGKYAVYVLFYPQLVAGPIERPQNILPQLNAPRDFSATDFNVGLRLMVWGLFKKVVIADNISKFIEPVFKDFHQASNSMVILSVFLFSIQIYCDFSGYSDIARGAARTMGIELMKNFNFPYFSKTIKEFWTRWHISLSTWFKDYLFIPLGGSRGSFLSTAKNYLIVFSVSGLWHGASYNFIFWGALHGVISILETGIEKLVGLAGKVPGILLFILRPFQIIFTFLLVSIAWVFFRVPSFSESIDIITLVIKKIPVFFQLLSTNYISFLIGKLLTDMGNPLFYGCLFLIVAEMFLKFLKPRSNFILDILIYTFLITAIAVMGQSNQESFIYFQF